jgi:DNA-binding beta-propeller fold protein YncE
MPFFPAARVRSVFKILFTLPLLGSLAFAQSVVATIPATDGTLGNPMSIAVNPLTARVYIAGSTVEVVDQKSNQILDTISVGSGQLQGIAVDPVLRRAYVADAVDGLFAIDLNTNTVVGNNPNSTLNGIAVNPITHRVYAQGPDNPNEAEALFVYDGPTLNLIATVDDTGTDYTPLPDPQVYVVVNPASNMIYVPINRFPGALWVVNGKTNISVTTITGLADLAYGADVDPLRNLIFVGGWFNQLSVVNGATNTLLQTYPNTATQPDGISVDPIRQKVYLMSQAQDLVQIFDEKTNTFEPTTIPVGGAPDNSAIDYAHGLLYAGNTGEAGGPPPPSVSVIQLQ